MAMNIDTDGTIDIETVLDGSLEQLNEIVGGYIEIVPIKYQGYVGIVCNENGKMLGLPINHTATGMFGSQLCPFDYLVGKVIVFTEGEIKCRQVKEQWNSQS